MPTGVRTERKQVNRNTAVIQKISEINLSSTNETTLETYRDQQKLY